MKNLSRRILKGVFDVCPEGVAIIEAHPTGAGIVSVNPALEALSGCSRAGILGKSFFFMSGSTANQQAQDRIEKAIEAQVACSVSLTGIRADDTPLSFDFDLLPIRDTQGNTTHFVGFYRRQAVDSELSKTPVKTTAAARSEIELLVMNDRLTGIHSREYFDELFERHWRMAQRDKKPISVFIFEPDFFAEFTSSFGPAAVNGCLRRVARVIDGSFRRAGDLGARYDNQQFIASVMDLGAELALEYGSSITHRIRDLHMHHPKSPIAKHLTVSVGIATTIPNESTDMWALVELAKACVKDAQTQGHDRVCQSSIGQP